MPQRARNDAADNGDMVPYAQTSHAPGPAWLRDTQRAMLLVVALSGSILLALLYFGGFLG